MRTSWKRKQQMVVVDASRGSIKLAAAEVAGEAVRFHGITHISIKSGESQAGGLAPAEIADRIRAEVERRKWRGMPAACLLSGNATSTQSFLFPSMPPGELRDALALKLAATLHFDLDQAGYDFRTIREFAEGGKKQVLVLAAAARKEAIRLSIEIMRNAGLEPVALGSAAESLANLADYARLCRDNEVSIHVDMGRSSTILNLFEGRWLRFSREIDCAGDSFTRALTRPIVTANGSVRLTYEQAEEVKLACGYPREDQEVALPHGVRPHDLVPLMEPVAQRLTSEIRRSIDYLCSILEIVQVDRIVLSGPGAQLRNLDTALHNHLDIPVVFTDPVVRARAHWRLAICDEDPPPLAGFSAILGHSLGKHQPINLLPREVRMEQLTRRVARVRAGIAPGALGLGVCLAAAAVPISGNYRAAAGDLKRTVELLDERARHDATIEAERERLTKVAEGPLAARGGVPDWTGLLKELALLLPREARLVSFSFERPQGKAIARIVVSFGEAHTEFDVLVGRLSAALAGSPYFRNVRVVEATKTDVRSEGRYEASAEIVGTHDSPWGVRR